MSLERSVSGLMYAVTIHSRMPFLQQIRIVIIIYPKGQFIKFAHLVTVFLFFFGLCLSTSSLCNGNIVNRRTAITTHTTCVIFCKYICDLFSFYVLFLLVCCVTYVLCVASIIFVYVILIFLSLYFMDVSSISCAHICSLSSIFNKHNILSSNSSRFYFSCSPSRASLDYPF